MFNVIQLVTHGINVLQYSCQAMNSVSKILIFQTCYGLVNKDVLTHALFRRSADLKLCNMTLKLLVLFLETYYKPILIWTTMFELCIERTVVTLAHVCGAIM